MVTPAMTIKTDILLNGSATDTTLSNAFPSDGVIIEGCNLTDSVAGKTAFIYNGGATNLSI